jgi:hypothetical protein
MTDKQIVQFKLEDGTPFLVEIDEPERGAVERIALPSGETVLKAQQTFEATLDTVKPVASVILAKIKELNTPASEVEVKFGLKLTVDAGAIFASVGGEVNYEITLKWKQD